MLGACDAMMMNTPSTISGHRFKCKILMSKTKQSQNHQLRICSALCFTIWPVWLLLVDNGRRNTQQSGKQNNRLMVWDLVS
jgi:hypothetical protein